MQEQVPPVETAKEKALQEEKGHLTRTQLYILLAILAVAILGLCGYIVWDMYQRDSVVTKIAYRESAETTDTREEVESEEESEETEGVDETDETTTEEAEIDETSTETKTCTVDPLGLTIDIPKDWTCISNGDYWLDISSDLFEIDIADGGRGLFCGSGPGDDTPCIITTFHTTPLAEYKLYNYDGENGEIFGITSENAPERDGNIWVSIKYDGMAERDLTSSEKAELTDALDSLSIQF